MRFKFGWICIFIVGLSCSTHQQTGNESIAVQRWTLVGDGFVALDQHKNQIVLAENPDSKGVMLVSPVSYNRNVILTYKVRPLSYESVLVVLLAVSDKGERTSLSFPESYDGNMGYLTTDTDNYFIAFHNKAHNFTPFIRKYPKFLDGNIPLASAPDNVMDTHWHDVEIGKKEGKIWLKIDGEIIAEANDDKPLNNGHIAFRIRGTQDRIAMCLIKDVVVR